jgi:hypothetical protein
MWAEVVNTKNFFPNPKGATLVAPLVFFLHYSTDEIKHKFIKI